MIQIAIVITPMNSLSSHAHFSSKASHDYPNTCSMQYINYTLLRARKPLTLRAWVIRGYSYS